MIGSRGRQACRLLLRRGLVRHSGSSDCCDADDARWALGCIVLESLIGRVSWTVCNGQGSEHCDDQEPSLTGSAAVPERRG
jgi:hypothetical protein